MSINRDLHITQIAELCNINKDAIRALNPQYRTDLIPGSAGSMTLCLPIEVLNTFIDLKDSVYNYRADELMTRRATVEVNDKLDNRSQAARHRSQSVSQNKSKDSTSSASISKRNTTSSNSSSRREKRKSRNDDNNSKNRSKNKRGSKSQTVTVKKGDTLIDIAKRNGTTVEKLKKANKIKGNIIKAGDKLKTK